MITSLINNMNLFLNISFWARFIHMFDNNFPSDLGVLPLNKNIAKFTNTLVLSNYQISILHANCQNLIKNFDFLLDLINNEVNSILILLLQQNHD